MGKGTRYPHVVKQLEKHYKGGTALELGAGGAVYKELFENYIGTDLLISSYQEDGDLAAFCDARYLPFENNSFDFVFQVASLFLIPEPERVCQEVSRVLRPNGKFIIFDYSLKTKKKLRAAYDKNNPDWHITYWTRKELCSLLTDTGFANAFPIETKKHWQIATALFPWISDHFRPWLMCVGEKGNV